MNLSSLLIKSSIVGLIISFSSVHGQPAWHAKLKSIDNDVNALLQKMTIEEKVGQMTQVTIDVVSAGPGGRQEPHALDAAKLETAILKYNVGSILNVGPMFHSVEHWHEVIKQIQDVATKKSRLKIPVLYGIDAIHGVNYTKGATLFPQSIGVAATWNPELATKIGQITAYEMRASGIPWNFNPVLDLGRQPLWPRFWETLGEDVLIAKSFGTAYVNGQMGADMSLKNQVAPCLKHYVGYGFPRTGRDRTPAWIDERMMREYFLPPFEAAIRAGVPTVMVNSAEVNGIPGHANYHLLTEVLKQEWNFQGFVVSDWEDIKRLYSRDRVADSPKEAVGMAVMAGVDMSMVPLDYSFYELLLQLVKEKSVPLSRIDDAVRRILRVKYLVGLFANPYPEPSMTEKFACKEHTDFNLSVAHESITLLKNTNNVLPLKKDRKVLVTGPTANMLSVLNGGWTITWQGDREDLYPKDKPTILKAVQKKVGDDKVTYVPGTGFDKAIDIAAVCAAADTADIVLVCLGEKAYCETPGNINDLTLDDAQLQLVEELAKKRKPIVLVLAEGRPRIIHRIVNVVDAIVMAYLPGMEGGSAIADILFGDVVPSGKLPFSYPKYPNSLVWYDCKPLEVVDNNTYDPEFPFGFGLSYTTFECSDLQLEKNVITMDGALQLSVSVKNTGAIAGKEVVQIYTSDLVRSVMPPMRELKAFSKVSLMPGESKKINFVLKPDELSFIGKENKRIVEKGKFKVMVGTLTEEFELK
jgi:beta-glucosidase